MKNTENNLATASPKSETRGGVGCTAGLGFLVVVTSGEYDGMTQEAVAFSECEKTARRFADEHNKTQKRRRIKNREYADVETVKILKPNAGIDS